MDGMAEMAHMCYEQAASTPNTDMSKAKKLPSDAGLDDMDKFYDQQVASPLSPFALAMHPALTHLIAVARRRRST